jgi:hypothetical protein
MYHHLKINGFMSIELKCEKSLKCNIKGNDQPRGLVVSVSDYYSGGPGFDSLLYHGDFSLIGENPHGDHGLGSQ